MLKQEEFNKMFKTAMEEYLRASEEAPVDKTMPKSNPESEAPKAHTTTPSSSATTGTPRPSPESSKATAHESAPKTFSRTATKKSFIEVTPNQVKRMYNLLTDVVLSLLDPNEPYDELSNYAPHIMALISEVNPSDGQEILDITQKKVFRARAEDQQRRVRREIDPFDLLIHGFDHIGNYGRLF